MTGETEEVIFDLVEFYFTRFLFLVNTGSLVHFALRIVQLYKDTPILP